MCLSINSLFGFSPRIGKKFNLDKETRDLHPLSLLTREKCSAESVTFISVDFSCNIVYMNDFSKLLNEKKLVGVYCHSYWCKKM